MMQRSSNAMVRNVLIGSISVILLISVLYYMKRVEVGRLKKDMDGLVVRTGGYGTEPVGVMGCLPL